MFFKNLVLLRFPTTLDLSEIDDQVAQAPLKPVGPLEMSSRGFISPFGRNEEVATHRVGDAIWLSVGGENKLLPGAVVNDMLARKLDELEAKEGRRPGGKTRKRLKDDLLHDLLPRAFVKPSRTDALIDCGHGFIAVDCSSRKTAAEVASELRAAMGSFPALPLSAETSPRAVLTGWLAGEPLPPGLTLGEECQLADPIEGGAAVRCVRQEIRSEEIDKHLEAGKQCTHLALNLDDHLSFVLGEDLIIRKLKFLDGAVEQLDDNIDDHRAELDAQFALMATEIRRLFEVLAPALKIISADVEPRGSAQSAAARPAGEPGAAPPARVGKASSILDQDQSDPLLAEARAHVVTTRRASVGNLMRVLKIGYNRAAWLIEALEAAGVVSRHDARGQRHVLVEA